MVFGQARNRGIEFAIGIALVVVLTSCSNFRRTSYLSPSYERLVREGFYVYVLPDGEVSTRGWEEEITIWSFDRHCRALTAVEQYNPLTIRYVDNSVGPLCEECPIFSPFSVVVGPWIPVWVQSEGDWREVDLELAYVGEEMPVYKESIPSEQGTFLGITFVDTFGGQVSVESWLSLTETVSLVNELEYAGPPTEEVGDPWSCFE
jgi:hypothetical protein